MIIDGYSFCIRSSNEKDEVIDIWLEPLQVDDEHVYQTSLPIDIGFLDFIVKEGRATTDQIFVYRTQGYAVKAAMKRIKDLIKSYDDDWKYTVGDIGLNVAIKLKEQLTLEFPEYVV